MKTIQNAMQKALAIQEALLKSEPDGDEGGGEAEGGHSEPDGDEPPMDAGGDDAGGGGAPPPMAGGAPEGGDAGGGGGDDMAALDQALDSLPPEKLQALIQLAQKKLAGGAGGAGAGAPPAGPPAGGPPMAKGAMPYNKANGGPVLKKSAREAELERQVAELTRKQQAQDIAPALAKSMDQYSVFEKAGGETVAVYRPTAERHLIERYDHLNKSEQDILDRLVRTTDKKQKEVLFAKLAHLVIE